jgi:hypothetical protein
MALICRFVPFELIFEKLPGHRIDGVGYRVPQDGGGAAGFLEQPGAEIQQPGGGNVAALLVDVAENRTTRDSPEGLIPHRDPAAARAQLLDLPEQERPDAGTVLRQAGLAARLAGAARADKTVLTEPCSSNADNAHYVK